MNLKTWLPAFLAAAGLTQALAPIETYGTLSVKNAQLMDSAGKAVTLRGMSLFHHLDAGGKEFYNQSVVKYVQTDWHNTVLRVPIYVDDRSYSGGTLPGARNPNGKADADAKVHAMIDACIEAGCYVIVDWHTEKIYQSDAISFFGALAKEYGNTPNIIWEIYNEPNGPGWGDIASYAKAVITEIRKSSNNVVLVGNSSWDQHPDEAGNELDGFQNIAYTVHFYNTHTHWGTVTAAKAKGHAVFASEWGMSGTSGDGSFQGTSSGNIGTWLSDLDSWNVSSCNWHLGNGLSNDGAGPGVQTSASLNLKVTFTPNAASGWADADLTQSGLAIRSYLRTKNPAWTLKDTSLKFTKPLALTTTLTEYVLSQDTVAMSASFSKSVAWSITETSTGGATYSSSGTGTTASSKHRIGARTAGTTTPFKVGETVTAVLQPGGAKVTYKIATVGSVQLRAEEVKMSWEGSSLFVPGDVPQGSDLQVKIRNMAGQVLWERSAKAGVYGRVEIGERPVFAGIQILEVYTGDGILRSRLAPKF